MSEDKPKPAVRPPAKPTAPVAAPKAAAPVTQKGADDKAKEEPKASPSDKPVRAPAPEMTREEGKERVSKLGNSTADTLYMHYISNKVPVKEAVRRLLKQFGKKA